MNKKCVFIMAEYVMKRTEDAERRNKNENRKMPALRRSHDGRGHADGDGEIGGNL